MKKAVIIALFTISILLLTGCKEGLSGSPAPPAETPEPVVEKFYDENGELVPTHVDQLEPPVPQPADVLPDQDDPDEEVEDDPASLPGDDPVHVPDPEPELVDDDFCGDGVCAPERLENCDSCYDDCKCKSPAECHGGTCVTPECGADTECDDGDACTEDTCYFMGHVNAYCGHDEIKQCRHDDGCCPRGCDRITDSDCEPHCGNEVCEPGETDETCEDDCGPQCGDGNCDRSEGEDYMTCPEDCAAGQP